MVPETYGTFFAPGGVQEAVGEGCIGQGGLTASKSVTMQVGTTAVEFGGAIFVAPRTVCARHGLQYL